MLIHWLCVLAQARHVIDSRLCAVKIITFSTTGFTSVMRKKVLREVKCLAKLDHVNGSLPSCRFVYAHPCSSSLQCVATCRRGWSTATNLGHAPRAALRRATSRTRTRTQTISVRAPRLSVLSMPC